MLENFVVAEVLKRADWAGTDSSAYHYRQRAGDEEAAGQRRRAVQGRGRRVHVCADDPARRAPMGCAREWPMGVIPREKGTAVSLR